MDAAEVERRKEARRAKLKISAKYRATLGFQHALERIDQRIDEIEPAQAEIDNLIEAGKTLEIEA